MDPCLITPVHVFFSHCEPTAVPLSLPNVSVTHVYNNVENTESVSYSVNNEYSAFPLSPPVADTAVSTVGEPNIDIDVPNITHDFNVIKTLKGIKMVHINNTTNVKNMHPHRDVYFLNLMNFRKWYMIVNLT